MTDDEIKPVVWMGDSRRQVRGFPTEVRKDIGAALYDAQRGDTPDAAKPFKGVGRGVFEIITRFDTDTYRTIYAVQIGGRVYILHAFQKKSPRGRKTAKQDIELIKRRYGQAQAMEEELNT